MAFDALAALRQAGNSVDLLTDGQQAILAQLTESEVGVLISVQERLEAESGGEVEGHVNVKIV